METKARTYERYAPTSASAPSAATAKTAAPAEKHNLPLKKFRIGAIAATVWENQALNEQGQPVSFKSVGFERSYKDAKGEWKNTTNLRAMDLPKAILVLNKAYEYLSFSNTVTEE